MDSQEIEMLARGLQAHKRKRKAPTEVSKERIDIPSSMTPIDATTAFEVASGDEVVPAVEAGTTDGAMAPSTSSSPPIEV